MQEDYLIVEISGKQIKVLGDNPVVVGYLGDVKTFESEKVILSSKNGKIEIGTPFLKQKIVFDVLERVKMPSIRVATYKPKANQRRVKGQIQFGSKIKLQSKKS